MQIRTAQPGDHKRLLEVWLRSVRATHRFLTEDDIQSLYPLVRDHALRELELWVITSDDGTPVGFMGLTGNLLEALFLDPDFTGLGGGSLLVAHAQRLKGLLLVDVNEQNPEARRFYENMGFVAVGRSETDGGGRPFPLIHMQQRHGAGDAGVDGE